MGRVKGAYGDIHNHKGRKVREIENTGCIALSLIITGHAMVKPLFFAVDNVNRSNAKIEVELTNELIKKVLTKERESNSGENKSEDEGEIEQENSGKIVFLPKKYGFFWAIFSTFKGEKVNISGVCDLMTYLSKWMLLG